MQQYIHKMLFETLKLRSILATSLITSLTFLYSCSNKELDIQTNFPFELEVRPVPATIDSTKTVEIRCRVSPEGNYNNVKYRIRYFQYDGEGILRLKKSSEEIWLKCADCITGMVEINKDIPSLAPNDPYLLPANTFNLYYTSLSKQKQSFTIWIKDNFGNERSTTFEFSPKSKK